MSDGEQDQSPGRDRTRAAILAAAASTWAKDRAASLADIAIAAGVGRSTIHRYFAGRDELLASTIVDSVEIVNQTIAEARLDHGPPTDALRRLISAKVEVGDRIVFLFDDSEIVRRLNELKLIEKTNDPVMELLERGQADGSFDASVSAEWIQNVIWALVYTGIAKRDDGLLLRHDVVPTILRTLYHGVLSRENPH